MCILLLLREINSLPISTHDNKSVCFSFCVCNSQHKFSDGDNHNSWPVTFNFSDKQSRSNFLLSSGREMGGGGGGVKDQGMLHNENYDLIIICVMGIIIKKVVNFVDMYEHVVAFNTLSAYVSFLLRKFQPLHVIKCLHPCEEIFTY